MRHLTEMILCLALLAGCQASYLKDYWSTHSIDYKDIEAAENQFADFAEKASAAPVEDALSALDALFAQLQQDTVAYYLYSDWMNGAFYHVLSPCRSVALYSGAVDHLVTDGIFSPAEYAPFLQKKEWIQYNQEGAPAFVPGVSFTSRTLVLVLDQGCPSCQESLSALSGKPEWADARKIAVCCGYGPAPDAEGWEYVFPENVRVVFDPQMTPVYFTVSADGKVETSYTPAI